jgi:hypothetical protein
LQGALGGRAQEKTSSVLLRQYLDSFSAALLETKEYDDPKSFTNPLARSKEQDTNYREFTA